MKLGRGGVGAVALGVLVTLTLVGCSRSPEAKSANFMDAGKKLMEQKDPVRAILQFRNAAQATPHNAEVFYQLGQAYLAANDATSGVSALKKAIALDPKNTAARLRLAQIMSMVNNQGVLEEAQQQLRALVAEAPGNADALHALAFTELKLGESQDAMESLSRAMAAAPQNVMIAATVAQTQLQQHDVKGAEETLKKVSEQAPNSADAAVVLGRFYAAQNRPNEAEQQFQRALTLDKNDETALVGLANIQNLRGAKADAEQNYKRLAALPGKQNKAAYAIFLYQEGRHDEAIRDFERLVKEDPEDRAARTRLIAAYRGANRPADADKVLSSALKKNPKDTDALLQRGEIELANAQYGQAESDFNQVLATSAGSPEVHYALAKLNQARGNAARYRQELSGALKLDQNAIQIRLELARALLEADNSKNGAATALSLLDDAPPFQKELTAVIVERNWDLFARKDMAEMRKGIDRGLTHERAADLLLQDAIWKMQSGKFASGQASLDEALKIDPSNLTALELLNKSYEFLKQGSVGLRKVEEMAAARPKSAPIQQFLGTIKLAKGDHPGARAAFLAAKAADPHFTKADQSLVQLDMVERKWDDASTKLNAMIARNASDSTARLWLGDVEALKGNLDAALGHYRKVVDSDPQNSRALNNLAFMLTAYSKKPEEALPYAQKAVQLAPQDPDCADTLGWVLYQKGLYGQAVKSLERAASKNGNVAWKYHLAMAYAKAGESSQAQTTLRAALKVNPKAPEAEAAMSVVGSAK